MMKRRYSYTFSSILALLAQQVTGSVIDVHILSGQSNASGFGSFTDGSYTPNSGDSNVQFYSDVDRNFGDGFVNSSWGTLADYNNPGVTAPPEFGLEVNFGRGLNNLGGDHAILKITQGSTSLSADWNSTTPTGTGGPEYQNWISSTTTALTLLAEEAEINGDTLNLASITWLQGESDLNQTARVVYEDNLNNLLGNMVSHLDSLMLDVNFTTDDYVFINAGFSHNQNSFVNPNGSDPFIRAAQQNVVDTLNANGTTAFNIDNTDIAVNSTNFINNGASIHFSGTALNEIGDRVANAFASTRAIPEPSTTATLLLGAGFMMLRRKRA